MKYNNNEPFKRVGTFHCSPFEQLCKTLQMECESQGKTTMIVNMGLDEWTAVESTANLTCATY